MKKNLLVVLLILISLLLLTLLVKQKNMQFPQSNKPISDTVVNEVDVVNDRQDVKESKVSNRFDLSNQNLEKLPEYVLAKNNLEELDISKNNISGALPAEIRHLQNLRVLNASNNKMTGVPAEVGQLNKLEVLDLSNNQLTGLPYELGNLKNLKKLNLSGNDYAQQDLDIIKESLPEDTEIIL